MRRVLVVAVALGVVFSACGKASKRPVVANDGSCRDVQAVTEEGQTHVPEGTPVKYRTDPPTSGSHWPSPARTGVYGADAPNDEQLVHNMEHGHVVIWYRPGGGSEKIVDRLVGLVEKDPHRLVLVAHTFKLPDVVVAFTSWGFVQFCTKASETMVGLAQVFIADHIGHGPEGSIPGVSRGEK